MWVLPLLLVLLIYAFSAAKSPELLLYGGMFCIGIGFIVGIPVAILYHYRLFREVFSRNSKVITHFHWAVDPRKLYTEIPNELIPEFNILFTLMIRCWYVAMGGCLLIFLWLCLLLLQ